LLDSKLESLKFVLHTVHLILFVLLIDSISLYDSLDLGTSLCVLFLKLISISSEQVNVVVKGVILLLGLDE